MKIQRIDSLAKLPPRKRDGHKGDFGNVLVVGGSRGMIGAAALAANAALRGGAGLVTFAVPETVQPTVAALCPCATSVPLACEADGSPARGSLRQLAEAAAKADVLAVGPGLGVGVVQQDLVRVALQQEKPLVLDADGLNNLSAIDDWTSMRRCPTVLTPHPGEFARLTGRPIAEIQSDRARAASAAVRQWIDTHAQETPALLCVLKGAATVVTDGGRVFTNETGNPGMATGGSGDVLTGLTAALIAQGLNLFDAACLSVHLHGRAGDMAAEKLGDVALIATDLLDYLPPAIKEWTSV